MTNWFWAEWADLKDPHTLTFALVYGVIFAVAAWLLGSAVHLAIHRYLDRAESAGADPTAIRFLGQLARLMVFVFAFGYYAHLVPTLRALGTAWLASVGVLSVVFGLAAQTTLSNLIAGVSLVLYRPFKVGDRVQVSTPGGMETGAVESIDLGYTILRTDDGRRITIPNSAMATQTCINLSRSGPGIFCSLSLNVPAAEIERARQIMIDAATGNPKLVRVDGCYVTALNSTAATLTITGHCADAAALVTTKSEVLVAIQKQLDQAGIKLV